MYLIEGIKGLTFGIIILILTVLFPRVPLPIAVNNISISPKLPAPSTPTHLETPAIYPFQPGFPINVNNWIERCSPTIIDIDNDGSNELIACDYSGRIFAYSASGEILSGYPLDVGGPIYGHLAFADLDNNGNLEIIVGVSSVGNATQGHVYVFRPNGAIFPGWPQSVARFSTARQLYVSTVAVADIDGDGDLEIAAGTSNNNFTGNVSHYVPNLYLWHHNGAAVAGQWPLEDSEDAGILGALALGDLNGDGQNDIIVARDYHRVFAYDAQGNNLAGWPRYTFVPENGVWNIDPRIVHRFSAPTMADLDLDGVVEYIVAGYRRPANSLTFYNNDLLVLQPNGVRLPEWELPAAGVGVLNGNHTMVHLQQAPVIADLNQDNSFDIIVPTMDGWIRAYNVDKTIQWEFDYAQGNFVYASEPVIGDVDDDGLPEIIFGTYDPLLTENKVVGLWILEQDGTPKAGMPIVVDQPGIYTAPSLGDLDGDGDIEIAAVARRGRIYVWDVPAQYVPQNLPWPMPRFNPQRTAFFEESSPSLENSSKRAMPTTANMGDMIAYTLTIERSGLPLTTTVLVTDIIPAGLSYITNSLTATAGLVDDQQAPELRWQGFLSEINEVQIHYTALVQATEPHVSLNTMIINDGRGNKLSRQAVVILNPKQIYLPIILRTP